MQYELCLFQINNGKKRKRGAVDTTCTLDLQCHLVKPVAEQNESIISECETLITESQTLHITHSSPPEHINIMVSDQIDSEHEILDINPLITEINVHHNSSTCSNEKRIENKIQSFYKKVSHGPVYVVLVVPRHGSKKVCTMQSSSKFFTCNEVFDRIYQCR